MPRLLKLGIVASGAFLLASGASAQYRPRYGQGPGPYYERAPYGGGLIDRVLADLDRAGRGYGGHRERKEIDQAVRDLMRFRENSMRGRFDRDRLDGAIHHIQEVVNSNRMHPRDVEVLSRDLFALRDFRSHRGYSRY